MIDPEYLGNPRPPGQNLCTNGEQRLRHFTLSQDILILQPIELADAVYLGSAFLPANQGLIVKINALEIEHLQPE
jgi:hypothetical protein